MQERILFVDDDPTLLDGLKRLLRPQRNEWDIKFALGPNAALEAMHKECFDVVVSDMRMPDINGAELLAEVRRVCPTSVRIILSGQADLDLISSAVGITHQYLAKPCDADELKGTITRACRLRDVLPSLPIKEIVSQVTSLPCLAESHEALVQELSLETPNLERIHEIISRDVALAAQMLQLVNSAFFGHTTRAASIKDALGILGSDLIVRLLMTTDIVKVPSCSIWQSEYLRQINSRSLQVADLARKIALHENIPDTDQFYTAGLLHDIGSWVLAGAYQESQKLLFEQARLENVAPLIVEYRRFGVSHAEVGAYLLGLWGLPHSLVEAASLHYAPEISQSLIVTVVHAAEHLVAKRNAEFLRTDLSTSALTRAGWEGKMVEWEKL